MSILVRHPSEVIPEGDFEVVIEEGGRRTVCRNVVPDDLDQVVPCVTTTVGDAAAPDDVEEDAGANRSPYTLFLGLDYFCNGAQTGSGAVSSCTPTGTSYQEILYVVDRETDPPESVRISASAGDGLTSEGVVKPRYLPLAINGAGCPGACTQGSATFRMQ